MTDDQIIADFVDAFAQRVQADDRILAAYVANLPPSPHGDRHVDLKLVIACRRDAFDELNQGLRDMASSIQPLVHETKGQFGGPTELITDTGLRIEFHLYKPDLGTWREPVARILKQTAGFFRPPTAEPERPPDPFLYEGSGMRAADAATWFWRTLPVINRSLRREELVFAHMKTLELLSRLVTLLAQRSPHLTRQRVIMEPHLDPDDQAALLAALQAWPLPTHEHIARRQLALCEIMSTRGRAVCESLGADYPASLERAMRGRMMRELAELGGVFGVKDRNLATGGRPV